MLLWAIRAETSSCRLDCASQVKMAKDDQTLLVPWGSNSRQQHANQLDGRERYRETHSRFLEWNTHLPKEQHSGNSKSSKAP